MGTLFITEPMTDELRDDAKAVAAEIPEAPDVAIEHVFALSDRHTDISGHRVLRDLVGASPSGW